MRRWIWFLIWPVLFSFVQFDAHAQTELIISIGYEWADDDNEAAYLDELIDIIHEELDDIFQENDWEYAFLLDENADIYVNLEIAGNDPTLYVDLAATTYPSTLPSIYLVPHMFSQVGLSGPAEDEATIYAAVDIISGVSAYILDECDLMFEHFEAVDAVLDELGGFSNQVFTYMNFYRANCALIEGDLQSAEEIYQINMEIYLENAFDARYLVETSTNLAWLHFQRGDFDGAFEILDEILKARPDVPHTYALALRAYLSALAGDKKGANGDMDVAIEIVDDDPLLFVQSALIFAEFEQYEEALADFNRAEKLNRDLPEIYFYRGEVFMRMHEPEEARLDFEQVLALLSEGTMRDRAEDYLSQLAEGRMPPPPPRPQPGQPAGPSP